MIQIALLLLGANAPTEDHAIPEPISAHGLSIRNQAIFTLSSKLRMSIETPDGIKNFGLEPFSSSSFTLGASKTMALKINGKTLKLGRYVLPKNKGFAQEKSSSVAGESKDIDGILGYDFLSQHSVVLDFLEGTATVLKADDYEPTFHRSYELNIQGNRIHLVLEDASGMNRFVQLIGQPIPAYLPFLAGQNSNLQGPYKSISVPEAWIKDGVNQGFPDMIHRAPDGWGMNPYVMIWGKNLFGRASISWYDLDAPMVRIDVRGKTLECKNPTDSQRLALLLKRFNPGFRWVPDVELYDKTIDKGGYLSVKLEDNSWILVETINGQSWRDLLAMVSSRESFPKLLEWIFSWNEKIYCRGRTLTYQDEPEARLENPIVVGKSLYSKTIQFN